MESLLKLKQRIKEIKLNVNKKYPELFGCLTETTFCNTVEKSSNSNTIQLKQYHDSLIQMLRKHIP